MLTYDLPLGTAQAPYNFVPLNHQVAVISELPVFNKYDSKRHSGYIQLHIESDTPLYIRDSLDKKELEEQEKANQASKRYINSDFYSPNGKLAIPGSSMRGMVRSLVEIASFGHFGFYNNSRLYFRALADVTNLKKEYSDKMSAWDKKTKSGQYKMKAGILRMRSQFDFEIVPVGGHGHDKEFNNIPKFAAKQILSELEKKAKDEKEKEKYKYGTFRAYWIDSKQEYIVVSGDMGNKKRDWIVKSKPVLNEPIIRLTEKEIEDYMNDTNRMAINLIYELRKSKKFVYEIIKDKSKEKESIERLKKEPKRYKALLIRIENQWVVYGFDNNEEYKFFNLKNDELLFKELEKTHPKKGEIDILLKAKFGYPHDRVTYLNDDDNFETPCFYTPYQYNEKEEIDESELSEKDKEEMKRRPNTHIAFGHTPMFRLPYEKRIGDLVPLHLKKKPEIIWNPEKEEFKIRDLDYANAIFGFAGDKKKQDDNVLSSLSGRVYFTDIVDGLPEQSEVVPKTLSNPKPTSYELYIKQKEAVPKILSGPKSTTFQHYVSQESREERIEEVKFEGGKAIKNRIHYNTKGRTEIRGNKFYWHKDINDSDWQAGNGDSKVQENLKKDIQEGKDKIHTIIKPAPPQTPFEGRIYFENLSDKELGALLFVLNLPEGCFHKIGMGKPLGLGTIKMKTQVFLSDKKQRYSSLQSEWQGLKPVVEENWNEKNKPNYMEKKYMEIFSNDVLEQTKEIQNHKDLWDTERLKELKTLLQKHSTDTQRKFRYMEIDRETNQHNPNTGRNKTFNEFRERPILSQPTKYSKEK